MRRQVPAKTEITCDFCGKSSNLVAFNPNCGIKISGESTVMDACIRCETRIAGAVISIADKIRRENS